jgi:hypothetical protein
LVFNVTCSLRCVLLRRRRAMNRAYFSALRWSRGDIDAASMEARIDDDDDDDDDDNDEEDEEDDDEDDIDDDKDEDDDVDNDNRSSKASTSAQPLHCCVLHCTMICRVRFVYA